MPTAHSNGVGWDKENATLCELCRKRVTSERHCSWWKLVFGKQEAKERFVRCKLCQRIPYVTFEIPMISKGKLVGFVTAN